MLFAVAGCRLWTLPVLDRPRRSARVSGPDPHTLRSAVGFQSVGIAPPTRVWRRILVRCLLCQVTSRARDPVPTPARPPGPRISAVGPDQKGRRHRLFRAGAEPVIELLDDYFDAIVSPIQENKGEILKFMGDGVLAIFPTEDDEDFAPSSLRALAAATQGLARLAALKHARRDTTRT